MIEWFQVNLWRPEKLLSLYYAPQYSKQMLLHGICLGIGGNGSIDGMRSHRGEKTLERNNQKTVDFVVDFSMPIVLLVIAINAVMADLEGYFDKSHLFKE